MRDHTAKGSAGYSKVQQVAPVSGIFKPTRLIELELSQALPPIVAATNQTEHFHYRLRALVRLHDQPLGLVDLDSDMGKLSVEAAALRIWSALGREIVAHMNYDGLSTANQLVPDGLPSTGLPRCTQERDCFLLTAPFATVVVATRERPILLAKCLDSILDSKYPAFDIVVVDNAPTTSATADLIREKYSGRPVRYVCEDRPGLAMAHNRGLLEVQAPIVAFTDDDVVVDRNWLAELVRGFTGAEKVVCVTGLILPVELETPAQQWFEELGGARKGFASRVFDRSQNRLPGPLYPYAVGALGSGANMAFRTDILWELGGFDPALGTGTPAQGGDDLAIFHSVIMSGYRLLYTPAALLYHRHPADWVSLHHRAFCYGVGLTAYLTQCVLNRPGTLLDFAFRLPFGLAHALSPWSEKNARKGADYPQVLTSRERLGMLAGPAAYLRSRWQARGIPRMHGQWPRESQRAHPMDAAIGIGRIP